MEGNKKRVGPAPPSPSPSFAAELFGAKESSPPNSSAGVFASIFPPPSTVLRKSSNSGATGTWQNHHHSGIQAWSGKHAMNGEGGSYGIGHNRERIEPCHLSSSIYYGGQENYSQSPSSQPPASYPIFKKDGGEDDPNGNNSNSASRGNWWQGSLYY